MRAHARAARESWDEYAREPGPERFRAVRGDDPAHLVKVALGEAAAALGERHGLRSGLRLRIESALPVGSGFGSSAATATAVIVAAYLRFRRPGDAAILAPIERIVLEAERRQHGLPSGIDGATVLHGGLLWARRLAAGGLETERVALRSPLLARLRVYDTGMPAETTGAVVAAVRHRRDRDPAGHERLLDRIEAATRGFRAELEREQEDPARAPRADPRSARPASRSWASSRPRSRALVRQIEAAGGAAKISGAGALSGPGAGSLLVYHPDPEWISGWSFLRPFPFHPVHLEPRGSVWRDRRMSKATVSAPANIAFVKYWGARDLASATPMNSSISMTLEHCVTQCTVETLDHGGEDEVWRAEPDGGFGTPDPEFARRVRAQLDRIRQWAGRKEPVRVATRNTFPTAGGLASSASGFAALTLAAAGAFGKKASQKDLSLLARRSGSGSACRSIFGGFVEWPAPQAEGKDERQLRPPDRRRRALGPAQRHRRRRDRPQDRPLDRGAPPRHHQPLLHQAPGAAARPPRQGAQGDPASATSTPSGRCSRRRRSTST